MERRLGDFLLSIVTGSVGARVVGLRQNFLGEREIPGLLGYSIPKAFVPAVPTYPYHFTSGKNSKGGK